MAKKRSPNTAIQRAPVNKPAPSSSEELPPFLARDPRIHVNPLPTQEEEELEASVKMMMRSVSLQKRHSGPLPDPDTLRQYAQIISNGAERIMVMTESEQRHRHRIDWTQERRAWAGVVFAFVLGLSGFGASAYALYLGQAAASCVAFVSTVAGIAGTFIYGTSTDDTPQYPPEKSTAIEKSKEKEDEK